MYRRLPSGHVLYLWHRLGKHACRWSRKVFVGFFFCVTDHVCFFSGNFAMNGFRFGMPPAPVTFLMVCPLLLLLVVVLLFGLLNDILGPTHPQAKNTNIHPHLIVKLTSDDIIPWRMLSMQTSANQHSFLLERVVTAQQRKKWRKESNWVNLYKLCLKLRKHFIEKQCETKQYFDHVNSGYFGVGK